MRDLGFLGMGRGQEEQCLKLCSWTSPGAKGPSKPPASPWSPLDTQTPRHREDVMRRGKYMLGTIVVVQLCPALCDPVDCSTPGFPVLHSLLEFAHTHVH